MSGRRCLLLFTKPANAGRVKTRLIGELSAEQAALLHRAFVDDLSERLLEGEFALRVAWALEEDESLPASDLPALRQRGADLGERLYNALAAAAGEFESVAAVGSDHPELPLEIVHRAFEELEAGADVVLGPASDGGYYLIGLRAAAVRRRLFGGIAWSTGDVLAATLERCRELDLEWRLLPPGDDVDTPADLARLERVLAAGSPPDCPRTRALLSSWNRPVGA